MGLFSSPADNAYLGIDIGDSSLKMVELVKAGKKIKLANYGFSEHTTAVKFTGVEDPEVLAKVINKMRSDLKIVANKVSVSLPSFAVFSSVVNLYNVNKKNIVEQVNEEAKKVIPLPLSEMVLDWKIIPAEADAPANNTRIFLTGSPKSLIKKYISVFAAAKLTLVSLETETFSLIRSLLGNDKSTVMIVDLGDNSTDICIVKESIPYLNRSINISGAGVSATISQKLGVAQEDAEQLKHDLTLGGLEAPTAIREAVQPIVNEITYMIDLFRSSNNQKIEKIILTGGGSLLVDFANYLEKTTNIQTLVGDPWFRVATPPEIQPVLREVGPRLAIAVGLALRGFK